jgi:hypothetical protein
MRILVTLFLATFTPFVLAFDYGKFNFFFNNDFTYQRNELADGQNQYYNSLSFFGKYGRWSGGWTLRTNNFYKQAPNLTLDEPEVDLYRKYIQFSTENLNVQAGDFYAMLGRGLVLSVLQNDKALRERTILGGDVRYERKFFRIRALGGTVEDELGDQKWAVYGTEAAVEYIRNHRVGFQLSYIDEIRTYWEQGPRTTYSVNFQGAKLLGMFNYYAEVARLDFDREDMRDGTGIYADLEFSRKRFSCLVEYKRYDHFDNGMNNPPVVDREDEVSILQDTAGIRFYAQYALFDPDIVVFANVGRIREFDSAGYHVYGGLRAEDLLHEKINFTLSYGVRDIYYPVKKTEVEFLYRFTDSLSLECSARDKRYSEAYFKFNEQDYIAQFSWSPYGSAYFQYQYSEQEINDRHDFFSGGIRVNIFEGSYVELSGGTVRGGQICAGGQCYFMPPFEGFKLGVYTTLK